MKNEIDKAFEIAKKTNLPVTVDNDATCAVAAELWKRTRIATRALKSSSLSSNNESFETDSIDSTNSQVITHLRKKKKK